jgi:hypothetical protein
MLEKSHLCDSMGCLYYTNIALHVYDEHMQGNVPCGVEHTDTKTKGKTSITIVGHISLKRNRSRRMML